MCGAVNQFARIITENKRKPEKSSQFEEKTSKIEENLYKVGKAR